MNVNRIVQSPGEENAKPSLSDWFVCDDKKLFGNETRVDTNETNCVGDES